MAEIRTWKNREWGLKEDTRSEPTGDQSHEDWMLGLQYENLQTFGNPDGYSYDVWKKMESDGAKVVAAWIISISDGSHVEDILVESMTDFADLMSHLGPGAVASCLDGEELSSIFSAHTEAREASKAMKEALGGMVDAVRKARVEGCDCETCKQKKEQAMAAQN